MKCIDLNADIAEGFEHDFQLLQYISSANICSGAYAGNHRLSEETAAMCRGNGVRVGWHIGFPDRPTMGRGTLSEGYPLEWIESVVSQIRDASRFAYIKPHGALYHWLLEEDPAHEAVWDALAEMEKPLMGMPGTRHEDYARRNGIRLIREGFVERRYTQDLRLVSRKEPDSMLHDFGEIRAQAVMLAQYMDTLCIHGDRPDSVIIARSVRDALEEAGYKVTA